MITWNKVSSGEKTYNVKESSGTHHVFKNDAAFSREGTKVGSADSREKALDIVKSDSGGKSVDIKKSS